MEKVGGNVFFPEIQGKCINQAYQCQQLKELSTLISELTILYNARRYYPGDIRWIGFGVRVSSFHVSKNARLVGPLGPGLRLVGRLRSGIMASASFQILFQGLISQRMFSQVISWKMTLQRWQRCLVTDLAETLGFQCTYLYLNAQKSLGSLDGAPQTSEGVEFYLYPTVITALIHSVKPGLTRQDWIEYGLRSN